MTEKTTKPIECVWHPVWSKPHRKEIMIALQRRFNDRAQNANLNGFEGGLRLNVDHVFYYTTAEELVAAHPTEDPRNDIHPDEAHLDLFDHAIDASTILGECGGKLAVDSPFDDSLLYFISEDKLRKNTIVREEYSEEHECTLLRTTAKPSPSF